jgi:hypothetical protein
MALRPIQRLQLQTVLAAFAAQEIRTATAKREEEAKKQSGAIKIQRDWEEDRSKKNTSTHGCLKCKHPFFGKKNRRYCMDCQTSVTTHLDATAKAQDEARPWAAPTRYKPPRKRY